MLYHLFLLGKSVKKYMKARDESLSLTLLYLIFNKMLLEWKKETDVQLMKDI